MKLIFTLLIFACCYNSNFYSQCDEYYINELTSGVDDKCYFPSGSPLRFCPSYNGISINDLTLDAIQWSGISTQNITVAKNGGNAGRIVLKLKEKTISMNLYGCGGQRSYSISLDKSELQNFYTKKDQTVIEEINSLVSKKEYEKAFDLTSKLLQKSN